MEQEETLAVETYTYPAENDSPLEVVLVGFVADEVGIENTFEPPGFHREHITTWLRERYFFLNGKVFAQVPRRIQEYPKVVRDNFAGESAFVTDVTIEGRDIKIYYIVDDENAVCLTWNTAEDHWSMESVSQPSTNGNIDEDAGEAATSSLVWSAR